MHYVKDALEVDFMTFGLLSRGIYLELKNRYEECKQLMNVTDEEIEVYRKKRHLMEKDMADPYSLNDSRKEEMMKIYQEIREGMKKHQLL